MSVTMKSYSPVVQTLYQEIVQQLHNASSRTGSVYIRAIKGIDYAYLKEPVGITRRDIFLGRHDDPAVAEEIEAISAANEAARQRRVIVRSLLSAKVPSPTSALGHVLDALSKSGLLKETVLVGTAAYQCYSPLVGSTLPSAALTTQDADLATASLALTSDTEGEPFEEVLRRADPTFRAIPALSPKAPPSSFRSATGFMVDLLTPQLRRDDRNPMPLAKLKAGAVPLQHLRWLMEHPVPAAVLHGSGTAVTVPSPARFAIHKLIIAQKRAIDRTKRQKDLLQAEALIKTLKVTDPWTLIDAFDDACGQGDQGWRQPIARSLAELKISIETPDS
jgi:hypothetical protein